MREPKTKKIYFTQETEDAIVLYNSLDFVNQSSRRSKLFEKQIYWPFKKIVESLIHRYKFYYFDSLRDIEQETIAHLVTKIDRYNPELNTKAFSYFSVVAKNYLIMANNKSYKYMKTHKYISAYSSVETNIINEKISAGFNKKEVSLDIADRYKNIINLLIDHLEDHIEELFRKKLDRDICTAIVEIMKRYENISTLHRKALYVLIREYTLSTTLSSVHISNVLKKINKIYENISKEYEESIMNLFLS